MPRSVEPSLPMSVRKISPTRAVLVHAGRDVALVAADRELVRDRLALARHPLARRAGLGLGLGDRLGDRGVDLLLGDMPSTPRPRRRRRSASTALLRVGAQRLRGLRAVAVDGQRLDAAAPGLDVGVGDVLDRRRLRQVDRLGDRARDERLDRAHHLDVAHVRDRALADRHVEHRQVLVGEAGRADDRAVLVDVGLDLLDLLVGVAERPQRQRDRAVDDRHLPAADELLELHEREVGLDAGRVAVHEERDRPRRREHRRLRVAVAVRLAERRPPRPTTARAASSSAVSRARRVGDRVRRVAVHPHDARCAPRGSPRSARTGPIAAATLRRLRGTRGRSSAR